MAEHSRTPRAAAGAHIVPPIVDNPSKSGDILTNMRRTPKLERARTHFSRVNSAFFGLDARLIRCPDAVRRRRGDA
jgi:hypothetical protein